jgi:hypothetical protein
LLDGVTMSQAYRSVLATSFDVRGGLQAKPVIVVVPITGVSRLTQHAISEALCPSHTALRTRTDMVVAIVTGGEGNHSWHRASPVTSTGSESS